MNIAMLKKKPLVMHIRGTQSSKLAKDIMRKVNLPNNWRIHMHCFTDTWKQCQEWADEWPEMKFGFTSDSFFAEVIENLSTSKILLETDAPYFLPEKVRHFLFFEFSIQRIKFALRIPYFFSLSVLCLKTVDRGVDSFLLILIRFVY